MLFLLVAVLSMRAAWILGGDDTCGFFSGAYDGLGYYQWLPAAFITGDFNLMPWTHWIAWDKGISLFTCGVAVLQLPFFLLAQLGVWIFGYPGTGYTPAHVVALMASTATYAGLGSVLAFKLARRFSNTPSALLAVLAIYAGSNLFYYATQEPLMSHVYSFFLVALFGWCSLRVLDGPGSAHVFLAVFSGALMVLVRQLNVVVFIFPFWMAITSTGGLKGAWRNLWSRRGACIAGLALGLVPWVLQSIYWHYITGSWYANGYSYKGEHFDFGKMVPGMVLFSPRNGWLVYSPVFFLAMGTLLANAWRNTRPARPVLAVLILLVLVYSAWWCWWLGGAFGFRGLIDIYGLLGIPMAWFFRSILRGSWVKRISVGLLLWVLVSLNFGLIAHRNYDVYCVKGEWPPLLEIIGKIAAGE
jgi:hypothetical protein